MITHEYKDFTIPKQSHYDEESVRYSIGNGGSGCPSVATGFYYNSIDKSYATIITSVELKDTLLLVGRRELNKWQLEVLYNWQMGPHVEIYAATSGPGKYTAVLEGPVTDYGERKSYTSVRQGIESGKAGSGHAVFFFDGKGWIHVWTSD